MRDVAPAKPHGIASIVATGLMIGIALALMATIFGALVVPWEIGELKIRYKTLWRGLPLVWLASLLLPPVRATLAPDWRASDLPLAVFAAVAAVSVALGGGHWGDVRSLVAAIGVGWMARSLFAFPARRALAAHYLGGTASIVVVRELLAHPHLLPPHEMGRYDLITANPNVLGVLFAMTLPIVLAETMATRGARRYVMRLYLATVVLGTILTFSRTAAIGAAMGTGFVLLTSVPRTRAMLALAIVLIGVVAVQRPHQWDRSTGDAQRVRIMRTSLALAAESPLLGVGFGTNNLERVFPDRYEAQYGKRVFRFHSMNQVVDLLVGTGLIGTVVALWWAAVFGRDAIRRWRKAGTTSQQLVTAGGLGACITIVVVSMGEPILYHGKIVPILFVLLATIERADEVA